MQTRRDQLHAYKFLTRRALASLVTGEPNVVELPMRRLTITTISGIMIAVLVAIGFAVFGLIKPSTGSAWKDAGAVIVERQTGATYVYIDKTLYPVRNYASAVIAVSSGQQKAHIVLVDRSDIDKARRGPTIGVDGLPNSLPSAGGLTHWPWTVCSRQTGSGPTQNNQLRAVASVHIGNRAGARSLPADQGTLVQTPADPSTSYLVVNGKRHKLGPRIQFALGDNGAPLQVSTAFLDATQPGSDLVVPAIPGEGQPGRAIDGQPTAVGQLVLTDNGRHAYVVLVQGLSPVNALVQALLETLKYKPITVSPNAAIAAVAPNATSLDNAYADLPAQPPAANTTAARNGGLCVVYSSSTSVSSAVPPSTLPSYAVGQNNTVTESVQSQRAVADQVDVPAGGAAFVVTSANAATGYIVAAPGYSYALSSPAIRTGFGYGSAKPDVVPAQLLQPLIPAGRALTAGNAHPPKPS